mmetsp:Transcript_2925/g.6392  ORF Transcript_2925/g.6392 Transcript_2925/m.6392 type:complete len:585 (+) Transcript_2925:218-1972(+)
MIDSLFLSPAFIFAETSFILVASFAAYELLVGDFIWAHQREEERRASVQSRRGRGVSTYDTFESSRQMHGHRSLSPGGRGMGGGGGPRAVASRRSSNDSYPPRSSRVVGGGNINNRDGRIAQEGYYSSPGDTRFSSPGRGSSGDSTRRLFYKAILWALLSRFILLPVETFCFLHRGNIDHVGHRPILSTIAIDSIFLRISQTFPDVAFASALGLLVIFCAQIAFAAMPPLTPDSSEESIRGDEDAETIDDGIVAGERDGLLGGEGATKGQRSSEGKRNSTTNILKRNAKLARTWCTRLSRTILASKKTFATWNAIIFISYAVIFIVALVPHIPLSIHELSLWTLMVSIYSLLLLSLVYVGALLGNALRPGIARRNNSDSLLIRLVLTCLLLGIMFVDRVVRFGMVLQLAITDSEAHEEDDPYERIRSSYRRGTIEYAFSESLPVLFILIMMHRKRKEIQNDVLILWSLFGSTGRLASSENSQLDTSTAMASTSGDGAASGPAVRAGLGSRRFQTYGGTRGDSFPPVSGNKPRRNIPRAVSSSGGGTRAQQQQQQQQKQQPSGASDALALESGSISMKGPVKPFT